MKQNIKVAKQLVKLAKSLIAKDDKKIYVIKFFEEDEVNNDNYRPGIFGDYIVSDENLEKGLKEICKRMDIDLNLNKVSTGDNSISVLTVKQDKEFVYMFDVEVEDNPKEKLDEKTLNELLGIH